MLAAFTRNGVLQFVTERVVFCNVIKNDSVQEKRLPNQGDSTTTEPAKYHHMLFETKLFRWRFWGYLTILIETGTGAASADRSR